MILLNGNEPSMPQLQSSMEQSSAKRRFLAAVLNNFSERGMTSIKTKIKELF